MRFYDILYLVIILEVLYKNKTSYSKEVYDKFLEFHRSKYSFRYKLYNIIIIAIILACIIYLVSYNLFSTAIIFCIIFVVFIFCRFLKPASDVNKEYNSEKIRNSTTYTFTFYDKYFIISDNKVYNKVKYYKLYRIFNTEKYYYLYIDKTHAFLIDKSRFIKGDYKDFYKFIKTKNLKLLIF